MLELEAKEWRQQLVLRCNSEFVCFLIGVVYLLFFIWLQSSKHLCFVSFATIWSFFSNLGVSSILSRSEF